MLAVPYGTGLGDLAGWVQPATGSHSESRRDESLTQSQLLQ